MLSNIFCALFFIGALAIVFGVLLGHETTGGSYHLSVMGLVIGGGIGFFIFLLGLRKGH